MNGRLYDPVLHRFLQPDNYVQDPMNSQNYNRYGYCWNNPLRFSDPSGEFVWFVAIGAVVGAYVGASIQQGSFNPGNWKNDWWKGAISGAFVGAAAGALVASLAPLSAGGIFANGVSAAGGITKAWGITTSVLTGANVGIVSNAISGGGWDGAWKAGVAGAVSGAWAGTGGLGLAKNGLLGSRLAGKLAYQAIGTSISSVGNNWRQNKGLFSRVDVGLGPVTFTLGKGQKLLQFGPNAASIITNGLGVGNMLLGGKAKWNSEHLGFDYIGGAYDIFNRGSSGAHVGGFLSEEYFHDEWGPILRSHEYTHVWDSRALGNMFLPNYIFNFVFSLKSNTYTNNYYETKAYGNYYNF